MPEYELFHIPYYFYFLQKYYYTLNNYIIYKT